MRSEPRMLGMCKVAMGSTVALCAMMALSVGLGCAQKQRPTGKSASREASAISPVAVEIDVRPDLSNIENRHDFAFTDEQRKFIAKNHLLIYDDGLQNPVSVYRETPVPFVTSDIVLHVYHILLADTVAKAEETILKPSLQSFLLAVIGDVKKELGRLPDTAKGGAKKLMVVLAVGSELLGGGVDLPADVKEEAGSLKHSVENCENIVFDERRIDGSLFKPRAAYELTSDPYEIEETGAKTEQSRAQYFRAVTWLGQAGLRLDDIESLRAVALLAKVISKNKLCRKPLAQYEDMIGFLGGPPDGISIRVLCQAADKALGKDYEMEDLTPESLEELKKALDELGTETILDRLEGEGVTAAKAPGIFRILPARYNLTGDLFQRILEDTGSLPSGLDYVHYVLGSERAGTSGGTAKSDRSRVLAEKVSGRSEEEWFGTLGEGIEYSLKSIVAPVPENYPHFMRTEAWSNKSINSALGGWVLLNHDLFVYQKHAGFYADGGGGWLGFDGYVEPNPEFFGRLAHSVKLLSDKLNSTGFFDKLRQEVGEKKYKVITSEEHHGLTGSEYATDRHYRRFEELLIAFHEMAKKELENKPFTEEEHTCLKKIGETFRFLTFDVGDAPDNKDKSLVCDVASEYLEAKCLEIATGRPLVTVAVVPRNGKLYISKGSIFSCYEMIRPLADRMTDSQWRGSERKPGDSWLGKQGLLTGAVGEIDDPKRLLEYLKDENPGVRASTAKRLVKLGAEHTFPEILKLLKDETVISSSSRRGRQTVATQVYGLIWVMRQQIGSRLDDMLMEFIFSVGSDAPIETQVYAVGIVTTQLSEEKRGSARVREYMLARENSSDSCIREEVARYKTMHSDGPGHSEKP